MRGEHSAPTGQRRVSIGVAALGAEPPLQILRPMPRRDGFRTKTHRHVRRRDARKLPRRPAPIFRRSKPGVRNEIAGWTLRDLDQRGRPQRVRAGRCQQSDHQAGVAESESRQHGQRPRPLARWRAPTASAAPRAGKIHDRPRRGHRELLFQGRHIGRLRQRRVTHAILQSGGNRHRTQQFVQYIVAQ